MTDTQQKTKNAISLKGSAKIVVEYLNYGINSILFQRGIYPPESFKAVEQFGLSILVSTDDKIISFLDAVLKQIEDWLVEEKIQKLSMVISNINTKEVLERWDFNITYEQGSSKDGEEVEAAKDVKVTKNSSINGTANGKEQVKVGNKDLKVIQREIQDVLRQICSTVSFLPLLDCICSFDLLIYAKPDCEVPDKWDEAQPVFIANSQELRLRSFSTSLHHTATVVSYKVE